MPYVLLPPEQPLVGRGQRPCLTGCQRPAADRELPAAALDAEQLKPDLLVRVALTEKCPGADRVIARLRVRLDGLRTGMADLAFDLERKGRCDAADVVMLLDGQVRELAEDLAAEMAGAGSSGESVWCPPGFGPGVMWSLRGLR